MKNTPTATARHEAIEATHAVAYVDAAPLYILVAAQAARRDIYDGVTPASDYAAVTAYFKGAADATIALAAQRAAEGS